MRLKRMDQLTHTVRRSNWINIIQQCQDRPTGTTAKQWLIENGISEKSYYYWLRKIRREVCEQGRFHETSGPSQVSFVEVPIKAAQDIEPTKMVLAALSPTAVIRSGSLTLELSNDISESMLCRLLQEVFHAWRCCWYPQSRDRLWIGGFAQRDRWAVHDHRGQIPSESFRKRNVIPLLWQTVRPHQGTSMDGRWFPSALQAAGGRLPVLTEDQRRGSRPYRWTVPVSYDGTESSEPQSQGSNTSKAHLIFVQNIDFLCLLSS